MSQRHNCCSYDAAKVSPRCLYHKYRTLWTFSLFYLTTKVSVSSKISLNVSFLYLNFGVDLRVKHYTVRKFTD